MRELSQAERVAALEKSAKRILEREWRKLPAKENSHGLVLQSKEYTAGMKMENDIVVYEFRMR